MTIARKKELFMLLAGDIALFAISLWLMLLVRYQEIPNETLVEIHAAPFALLFIFSLVVFYIAGLYGKHTLLFKRNLPGVIFNAQVANAFVALIIFYIIPFFNIAPKRNLLIYLVISSLLVYYWRVVVFPRLGFRKRENAILIGSGEEMRELKEEVNHNPRYNLHFTSSVDLDKVEGIDFSKEILNTVYSENINSIVVDLKHERVEPILPKLYNLIFSHVRFIDKYKVYEDIFDRVPLSLLTYSWFLENISHSSHLAYDFLKRSMDVIAAFFVGVVSLIVYPFVIAAIKLDDGGKIFITQERIGKGNKKIHIAKFRSMTGNDSGKDALKSELSVTRVGSFLRKTRIDELPQLWNVLKGDLSLIGPRPELPVLVDKYKNEIPYYGIRHIVTPGLSGWAQIYHDAHPHHGTDVEETKRKLSYDLYYIRNRSFLLDVNIALKTIRTLLSKSGV